MLAVVGAACSVPGGEVRPAPPARGGGKVPAAPPGPVPPQYAKGDAAAGKAVFAAKGCAACHTLADAAAKGTVGPNLDEAKPTLALAVDRLLNGKGAMP